MTTRKPIVQIVANLDSSSSTPADASAQAVRSVLGWLRDKQRVSVPDAAFSGRGFEIGAEDGLPVSVETIGSYWACQYDKLDPDTPGRIWRTELSIAYGDDEAVAGVRLTVLDTTASPPPAISVPRVVSSLASSPGLVDAGVRLGPKPSCVSTRLQAENLVSLLLSDRRTVPVVVFAEGDTATLPSEAEGAASMLAGLAHIVVLKKGAIQPLIDHLGKEFAVWNGAVRTYYPKFNPHVDESTAHPLATRPWIQRRFQTVGSFAWMLLGAFASRTVKGDVNAELIPTFRAVKEAGLQRKINQLAAQSQSVDPQLPVLERQVQLLNQQLEEKDRRIEELKQDFNYADEEEKKASKSRDAYRAQLSMLRSRIDALELKLKITQPELEIPASFDGLSSWVEQNFPERLELRTRAARAANKSGFQNPALVYRCLARLAREYVDCRRLGKPLDRIFDDLGVRLERTGSASELAQWSDLYWVKNDRGENTFLDWHIKQGSDKNDQTTLRIYFYYDEEDERVVVGHLPTHLPNAKT